MTADKNALGDNELVFLPLGGAGEIGMNLNLYGYGPKGDKRWIMVDLGITFNNGSIPGLDVIMPDPTFIEDRRDRLDSDPRARRPYRGCAVFVGGIGCANVRDPVYGNGTAP